MRFGCCVSAELMEAAADVGYDFAELPVAVLCPEKPESEFLPVQQRLHAAGIKPEVWNLDLPIELNICGPSVDWPRVARYVTTALRRAAAVGGSVVAFPCGACSKIPKSFKRADALAQLTDFLRVCGTLARKHALIVGVEPLSAECSDLINSVPQAMDLARRTDMPEVGVLPNCFHMAIEAHSFLDVVDAAAWLAHVHIAAADLDPEPVGRGTAREFLEALRMAEYDGRIAVQGDWTVPHEDMGRALESLRRCCHQT